MTADVFNPFCPLLLRRVASRLTRHSRLNLKYASSPKTPLSYQDYEHSAIYARDTATAIVEDTLAYAEFKGQPITVAEAQRIYQELVIVGRLLIEVATARTVPKVDHQPTLRCAEKDQLLSQIWQQQDQTSHGDKVTEPIGYKSCPITSDHHWSDPDRFVKAGQAGVDNHDNQEPTEDLYSSRNLIMPAVELLTTPPPLIDLAAPTQPTNQEVDPDRTLVAQSDSESDWTAITMPNDCSSDQACDDHGQDNPDVTSNQQSDQSVVDQPPPEVTRPLPVVVGYNGNITREQLFPKDLFPWAWNHQVHGLPKPATFGPVAASGITIKPEVTTVPAENTDKAAPSQSRTSSRHSPKTIRGKSNYNDFMKAEIARLKAESNLEHKVAFKQAAKNWSNTKSREDYLLSRDI